MSQYTPGLTLAKCGCLYAGAVQMCPTHAKAPEMRAELREASSRIEIDGDAYPVHPLVAALLQAVSEERDALQQRVDAQVRTEGRG